MRKVLLAGFAALGVLLSATSASAIDIQFSIADGPTSFFYGRDHLVGTTVEGILLGLTDNATSNPNAIQFTSVPVGLGLVGNTFTAGFIQGAGITLNNGTVTAADLFFNFGDDNFNQFQLRLNESSDPAGANWLFWNGGNTPVVGTGNTGGFAGATYGGGQTAVPEPATWAMMIIGFGAAGAMVRRRKALVA